MKRSNIQLETIIGTNRIVSIKDLRQELKIASNSALIRTLIRFLESSIDELDYSSDLEEYKHIARVLNYLKPKTEIEYNLLEHLLEGVKTKIDEKKKKLKTGEICSFLDNLIEKISTFLIEMKFQSFCGKSKPCKNSKVDGERIGILVDNYVFKYQDCGHLQVLLSLYPNACNTKASGKTIVLKMLQKYFTVPSDRIFLARAITLFISNRNYNISDDEKKEIEELCMKYSILLGFKDLLFVKEILTSLGIKQEIDTSEKMAYLKMRYGIQDIEADYYKPSYDSSPVDLTDRHAFTIDSVDTIFRDDAFSISGKSDGTIELGIYITDLSNVKEKSPIDLYAYNHFSTIYTEDSYIPMIPQPFSLKFSLDKGLRRVMAFTFRFTKRLELIDCEITQAVINVRKNMDYLEASDILKNGGELYSVMVKALDLAEAIGDSLGMIDKYHKIKNTIRELGSPLSDMPEKYFETPGSKIITNMAIFTNSHIANIFDKSRLPFIYRVNDFDITENIHDQLRKYHRDKKMCDILRTIQSLYKPSSYSDVNIGHKGLGLPAYTSVTNPGRLYPSMMIQRMLIDLFVKGMPADEYAKKYKDVAAYARDFTKMQERNRDFMNEYDRLCRVKER